MVTAESQRVSMSRDLLHLGFRTRRTLGMRGTLLHFFFLWITNCCQLTHWPLGDFRYAILKPILVIDGWSVSSEIALSQMSLDLTDDKPILVQVMAWCHQATSHYLSQWWHSSMSPYGLTWPQWKSCTALHGLDSWKSFPTPDKNPLILHDWTHRCW